MSAGLESPEAPWPLGSGVRLLHRDPNGVVALAKPAGVLSHPNVAGDEVRSLLRARYSLEEECYEWPEQPGQPAGRLWLLNRLDSGTSGVILAAESGELAREIRAQFKRKQVRKVYQALVFGVPRPPVQLWKDLISVEKRGGQIRSSARGGHVPAESQMNLVRAGRAASGVSLVRLEPRTGRSHQLRVQCAKRGLPIAGDQTYGDFARNREFARAAGTRRMFLHSLETQFGYEWAGARHTFSARAPLPVEFEQALSA
ncbi:MAG: RluA family pseudouridine synthase [Opitutaceae bacterium]